jgi:hypothetical protein
MLADGVHALPMYEWERSLVSGGHYLHERDPRRMRPVRDTLQVRSFLASTQLTQNPAVFKVCLRTASMSVSVINRERGRRRRRDTGVCVCTRVTQTMICLCACEIECECEKKIERERRRSERRGGTGVCVCQGAQRESGDVGACVSLKEARDKARVRA